MNRDTQKIFLYSVIVLIYATLLVPSLVSTSLFFPYITGKAFMFRILVELATLLYIILAVFDKTYLPKRSSILNAVVVFTAVLGISTLNAQDPSKALWSNFERMEGYITIIHLFFFFIVTTSVIQTRKAWYALLNTTLVISILMGLRAFAEYDTSRDGAFLVEVIKGIKYFFLSLFGGLNRTIRIAGSLGNSSYLGVYSLIHAFIAGLLFISLKGAKKFRQAPTQHILYVLAVLFNVIVLYNTGTRGSFVGLIVGLFISALIPLILVFFGTKKVRESVSEKTKNTIKKISAISLIVIIVAVGLLGVNKESKFVKSSDLLTRFGSLITFDVKGVIETQGKARTLLWGMAWKGVEERPILGWGQDNFPYVFSKYYDPRMYAQEQWFDRTHNVFFDWLIAGGFLGLISYLSLFFALLYTLWKKTHLNKENPLYDILEKAVITGLLTAYFVHNFFIFDNLVSYILFFLLLAYVNQQGSLFSKENVMTSTQKHEFIKSGVKKVRKVIDGGVGKIAIILIAILAFGYASNVSVYKPYMAGRTLIKALQLTQPEAVKVLGEEAASPKVILGLFKEALAYDTFANTEIRERLAEVTPNLIAGSKDAELVTAFTTLVATEYQKAIKETPSDPRPFVFLSLYLQKFGLYKEAGAYIDKAIALSPTKQSFIFQKGIVEVSLGEYSKAVETLKRAYDLEPSSKESRIIYSLALIYADNLPEAKKILNGEIDLLTDERIIGALLQKKLYNEIISIGELKISSDPNSAQTHMSLAGLYLKINRRAEAITQIKRVIELAPDFKATGEFYINEILAGRDPSKPTVK